MECSTKGRCSPNTPFIVPSEIENVGECQELVAATSSYALQLLGRVHMACLNWDRKRVCVTQVERWAPDNLHDCIDGTPLLSLDRCIGDVIARVAKQAIAAPALPVQTTN